MNEVVTQNVPMVKSIASENPKKVWVVVHTVAGREKVTLFYDYVPHSVMVERLVGMVHPVIEITELPEDMWGLTPRMVMDSWYNQDRAASTSEDGQARHEKLMKIDALIRGSNQEGEVASAKAAWKRMTGKDWVDR